MVLTANRTLEADPSQAAFARLLRTA
jgi:putative addiction module component (TIGR02574 family)